MAEGTERHFSSEFKLFLPIVKGSSAELRPWLYLVNGIKLLKRKETAEIAEETKSLLPKPQTRVHWLKT